MHSGDLGSIGGTSARREVLDFMTSSRQSAGVLWIAESVHFMWPAFLSLHAPHNSPTRSLTREMSE